MEKAISAADANRRFSELLRTVRKGKTVVVTSHGKPVARIVPMTDRDQTERGARVALFARLRSQPVVDIGRWSRDELYEDRG
jgi:prevent-host-death family protein